MLSQRLKAIANKVPPCRVLADIGTDHGYLPIALVQEGVATKAWAMDIHIGPLSKAISNIKKANLEDQVLTKQSDGLRGLPSEVEVVVIAGMGGMTIKDILEEAQERLSTIKTLVLSPHLDAEALRRSLHQLGFRIIDEDMVEDQGKYYPIMVCESGDDVYTDVEYKYGKQRKDKPSEIWLMFIHQQIHKKEQLIERLSNATTKASKDRRRELEAEVIELKEVAHYEAR